MRNIYTPEWKQSIMDCVKKKYGETEWVLKEIMGEHFEITWNRIDIKLTRMKGTVASGPKKGTYDFLFFKGVINKPIEYLKLALRKERVIGFPSLFEVLVQTNNGSEYTVKKSIEFWDFNRDKLLKETNKNATVWVLIDDKLKPWEFVDVIVEYPEPTPKRTKGVRTIITG